MAAGGAAAGGLEPLASAPGLFERQPHCRLCGQPRGKAGAYGVQGRAAAFIEHISGSYSGIMGLPLFETAQLLEAAGATP